MARDTLLVALFIAALFAACGVLAFWPALSAVVRRTDRQITRWVQQDAPRP